MVCLGHPRYHPVSKKGTPVGRFATQRVPGRPRERARGSHDVAATASTMQ